MSASPDRADNRHLIFIHGGGVGPWMWCPQRDFFDGAYRVHTPFLPGHNPDASDDFTPHAAAARSIAEQTGLEQITGDVTVIGFSAGGQIAIELAAAYPERITRAVVTSSLLHPLAGGRVLAGIAAAAAPLGRLRGFAQAQAKQLYVSDPDFDQYFDLSRSISTTTLFNLMRANFSFRVPDSFRTHSRPTLLLAGAREQRSLIRGMKQLNAELSDSRFDVVEGVAHGIPLAQPERFAMLLDSWLAALEGRPARDAASRPQ
ncbi:alpha/beta fold hydrolase [Salinibacterium sp. ZJ450]|uniref:alpha/beta fold hydrolase n=1 Tax=Salinibacterium sp. ZJ450 TaxID=2708338 RepID=UPI0014240886|nr:alpha/beta hydrolase [Salinibacterium sp. ZJ450]